MVSSISREVIFYFMIELQSTVDFTIPFRLLIYMIELYKRLFLDTDEALFEINNLISSVFALDKKQDAEHFIRNINRVAKIFMNLSQEEQVELKDWLRDVLMKKVANKDKKIIEETLNQLGKGEVEDMTYGFERMLDDLKKEGIEQGEIIKTIKVTRKMLKREQSLEMTVDVLEMSETEVENMIRLIKDNKSLSDVELAKLIKNKSTKRHGPIFKIQ